MNVNVNVNVCNFWTNFAPFVRKFVLKMLVWARKCSFELENARLSLKMLVWARKCSFKIEIDFEMKERHARSSVLIESLKLKMLVLFWNLSVRLKALESRWKCSFKIEIENERTHLNNSNQMKWKWIKTNELNFWGWNWNRQGNKSFIQTNKWLISLIWPRVIFTRCSTTSWKRSGGDISSTYCQKAQPPVARGWIYAGALLSGA